MTYHEHNLQHNENGYVVTVSMAIDATSAVDAARQFAQFLSEEARTLTYSVVNNTGQTRPELVDLADDEPGAEQYVEQYVLPGFRVTAAEMQEALDEALGIWAR